MRYAGRLAVGLALVAGCGAGADTARDAGLPPATGPANATPPADPVVDRSGRRHAERLVPSGGGRGVRLRGTLWSAARSPDGRRVALGVAQAGRVQLADLPPRRAGVLVSTQAGTPITGLAWPRADRVLAVSGLDGGAQSMLLDVDPVRGTLRRERVVDGAVMATHGGRLGLTAVLAPVGEIGEARLLHVGPDGRPRTWPLPGVGAGEAIEQGDTFLMRRRTPGLAVSEADARAFVVAPGRGLRIVEVDLRTGRTAAHAPSERRGLIAGLLRGLTVEAEAKAGDSADRQAFWLGDGRLAVTGADERFDHATGAMSLRPLGLRIVDVRDWSQRVADRHATYAVRAGDGVAIGDGVGAPYGVRFEGPRSRRDGVRAFDRDGRERWAFGAGTSLTPRFSRGVVLHVLDHRARRMVPLDLRTGRPAGAPAPPGRVPLPLP